MKKIYIQTYNNNNIKKKKKKKKKIIYTYACTYPHTLTQ